MQEKQFVKLEKHPGIWRVDGFGRLSNLTGKIPQIEVCFTPIQEDHVLTSLRNSAIDTSREHIQLTMPVTALHYFKVGQLWKDGKAFREQAPLQERFCVDPSRMRLVRLKDKVELNSFSIPQVLPVEYYKLGQNWGRLSDSYYALVPVVNNPRTEWLVTPASELFRFYLGVSSAMCSTVITNDARQFVDWNKSQRGSAPILALKKEISRAESFVLLRSLASKEAKVAYELPHKHLSQCSVNSQVDPERQSNPPVLKATFPYASEAHLTVTGKKMPFKESNGAHTEWAVFATSILYCTKDREFDDHLIKRDYLADVGKTMHEGGSYHFPGNANEDDTDEDDMDMNDDSSDRRVRRLSLIEFSCQFEAMKGLQLKYRNVGNPQQGADVHIGPDIDVGGHTISDGDDGTGPSGNRGVDGYLEGIDTVAHSIEQFLDVVLKLRKLCKEKSWKVVTRSFSSSITKGTDVITSFPLKMGKRRTWHLIDDESQRARQLVWAEIQIEDNVCLNLVELERKVGERTHSTALITSEDASPLSNTQFMKLLKATVICNGWPSLQRTLKPEHKVQVDDFYSSCELRRISHPGSKCDDTSESKLKKIDSSVWAKTLFDELKRLARQIES